MSDFMRWEDIGRASDAWRIAEGAMGSPFDEFRGKFLRIPNWFVSDLDPLSPAYTAQQDRLWREMVDLPDHYDVFTHEVTDDSQVDPIVRPGLYSAPSDAAGNHLIAMGHIVKRSNIKPGSRVIEYGAGFGQNAVTFARLGCEVHTVDIDETFCSAIRKQADFFRINLTPHRAVFGFCPGGKFDLIVFYECFHHARDFLNVIPQLYDMLNPGGRVIMAGEPVCMYDGGAHWLPYPWGIRLDAEVAAITRIRKWYEMGFRQDFLTSVFDGNGFSYEFHPGVITPYADLHEFVRRDDRPADFRQYVHYKRQPTLADGVDFAAVLPKFIDEATGLSGVEPTGRWSDANVAETVVIKFATRLPDRFTLVVAGEPFGPNTGNALRVRIGKVETFFNMPGAFETEVLVQLNGEHADTIEFIPPAPTAPIDLGVNTDTRKLGVFFKSLKVI